MKGNPENRAAMTIPMIIDFIDIGTDALKAQNDNLSFNLTLSDTKEKYYIERNSGVLLTYEGTNRDDADCSITCTKLNFLMAINGDKEAAKSLQTEGDATVLQRLGKYMEEFPMDFNIVEP